MDLSNIQVDRDRLHTYMLTSTLIPTLDRLATVEQGAVDHTVSTMWLKAIQQRPDLVPRYMSLLAKEGCSDVKY